MNNMKKLFEGWTLFEKGLLIVGCVLMGILSIVWKESPLGITTSLAGIISVILCAKGKIENYYFGLYQAITYIYIAYNSKLYGEVMYNLVMIPMIIVGYFTWKNNMEKDNSEVKARNLTVKGIIILVLSSIILIFAYAKILELMGGNFAIIDAASTVLSIVATILMIARYTEQWIVWIIVNVVSVILWIMPFLKNESGAGMMIIMW